MRPGPVSIPTRPIRSPPQETNQLLQQAKWVYIRRGGTLPPLTPPYAGPYAVAEAGEKTFEVLVGGQRQRISVDRLKPHTGPAPVTASPPARRGRPPKERTAVVAATNRTYAERKSLLAGALCSGQRSCIVIVFNHVNKSASYIVISKRILV
jgi:hypothetical protein